MTAIDLDHAVRAVLARELRLAPAAITDAALLADLGVDEDHSVLILSAVEEALDVRFPDDFLEGIHTFGQLTTAIQVAVGPFRP